VKFPHKQRLLGQRRWGRRELLYTGALGAGAILTPGFLASCAGPQAHVAGGALAGALGDTNGGGALAGHFESFGVDAALLARVLQRAMGRGGDYADLYFQHQHVTFLALEDGEVNQAYGRVDLGCGVRVLKGDQTGFAFTEDLSLAALLAAADTAAAVAEGAPAVAAMTLKQVAPPANYYRVEIPWADVAIADRVPLLLAAHEHARKLDPRVVTVRLQLGETTDHVLIATSEGVVVEDTRPMTEASVSIVAEQNGRRESNGESSGGRRGFELVADGRLNELVESAVRRTVVLFDAVVPPPGEYPVVMGPGLPGILLHEAIGHGMEADFNRKGVSVYADKVGKRIAPEFVTIVDDGTNPGVRGSLNVDDEGTPTERTVLVENGILTSYMHDRISAAHYGVKPTGNGRRNDYRHPPVPRMRNTFMVDGPHDPKEIVASVKRGLYAETFTNGQVRIGSGDFSFYLKNGYLIEDGKLTQPVKDANLIGFGPDVLEKIEMVGNDLEIISGMGRCGKDGQWVPVGFGLPTTKCSGMSVGGVG
jgi:TldD protein